MRHYLTQPEWVAIAAHRLQFRWRSISPEQLEEVAAELWQDEHLSGLEPARAVDTGLTPLQTAPARLSLGPWHSA